jgi:predicted DNA-binding transcriptional regulator AlpA
MPTLLGITYNFNKALPKIFCKRLMPPMETPNHIGTKLRHEAESRNLKEKDVAAIFGVKPPSVYDWYNHGRVAKKHYAKLVEWSGRSLAWWLDVPEDAQHVVQEPKRLYAVKKPNHWPFELFGYDAWMQLSLQERQFFENAIAGAIQRAKQTPAKMLPAPHSTL